MPGATAWTPRDTNKQVSMTGSPHEIEVQCAALHGKDKGAESARRVFIGVAIAAGVVTFIGAMIPVPVAAMVGVLVVVLAVVGAIVAGSDDVEDRKLELVRTLVATFKDELRPGRPVDVKIDFRGYWRFSGGEPWLRVKMTLDNGVVAEVSARSSCKRKSRAKRKYTKIKDKIVETLIVRFLPPKGQSLDAGLQAGQRSLSIGALTLRSSRVAPRAAVFVYATPTILRVKGRAGWSDGGYATMPGGQDAVRALITSYHLLGRAGAQAAAAAAG